MDTIFYLYLGGGLLLIALSIPLILRRIKPNYFYGFRVKATLEDPGLWYEINAYAGRRLLVVGLLTIAAAAGFKRITNITLDAYALSCMAVTMAALILTLVQSAAMIRRKQQK